MNSKITYQENMINKMLHKNIKNEVDRLFSVGDLKLLDGPLTIKELSPLNEGKDVVIERGKVTQKVINTTIFIRTSQELIGQYGHYIDSNYNNEYLGLSHSMMFSDIVSKYRTIFNSKAQGFNGTYIKYSNLEENIFACAYVFYFIYFIKKIQVDKIYNYLGWNASIFYNNDFLKEETIRFFNNLNL